MSSSEDEVFDLDVSDSESDGYAPPAKKTTKAAPKKAAATKPATKAAPKTTAKTTKATKKKSAADKENDATDAEALSDDDDTPAPSKSGPSKKKTASDMYQKVSVLPDRVFLEIIVLKRVFELLHSSHNSNIS